MLESAVAKKGQTTLHKPVRDTLGVKALIRGGRPGIFGSDGSCRNGAVRGAAALYL